MRPDRRSTSTVLKSGATAATRHTLLKITSVAPRPSCVYMEWGVSMPVRKSRLVSTMMVMAAFASRVPACTSRLPVAACPVATWLGQ